MAEPLPLTAAGLDLLPGELTIAEQPDNRGHTEASILEFDRVGATGRIALALELFSERRPDLIRLAAHILGGDEPEAENVVGDFLLDALSKDRNLRNGQSRAAYEKQSVVNRSRSVLRHRSVVSKHAHSLVTQEAWDMTEEAALAAMERSDLVAAIRELPSRQREAIVLRYFGGLSEAQIAAAMVISCGAVKSHTARAIAKLRAALDINDFIETD